MAARYYTTYDAHCLTHAFNVFSKWKVPLIVAEMDEIPTSKTHIYYFHRSKDQIYTDYDNESLLHVVNNLSIVRNPISLERLLSMQTFHIQILLNNIRMYMRYTLSDDFCDFWIGKK